MRISDWSSDVCSSDLADRDADRHRAPARLAPDAAGVRRPGGPQRRAQRRRDPAVARVHLARRQAVAVRRRRPLLRTRSRRAPRAVRKSVVEGKTVSVLLDPGGRRIMKKKKQEEKK